MATSELAATYASLILADEGVEITGEKIHTLTNAAKVDLEPIWADLVAKALAGKDIHDLLTTVGGGAAAGPAVAAPAAAGGEAPAEEKKEEKKEEKAEEESDDDMGFGLFD